MTTTRQQIYGLGYQWRGSDIPVMTLSGSGSFVYRLSECLEQWVAIPGNAEMAYSASLTFVPEGVETATLPEFEEMP